MTHIHAERLRYFATLPAYAEHRRELREIAAHLERVHQWAADAADARDAAVHPSSAHASEGTTR